MNAVHLNAVLNGVHLCLNAELNDLQFSELNAELNDLAAKFSELNAELNGHLEGERWIERERRKLLNDSYSGPVP